LIRFVLATVYHHYQQEKKEHIRISFPYAGNSIHIYSTDFFI